VIYPSNLYYYWDCNEGGGRKKRIGLEEENGETAQNTIFSLPISLGEALLIKEQRGEKKRREEGGKVRRRSFLLHQI